MYSQTSHANQSFPYLPLTNAGLTDLARQIGAARPVHANSLSDLKAAFECHDTPAGISSRMAAMPFGRPPASPRLFQRQMSFSEEDVSFVHANEIGWNLPPGSDFDDPRLLVRWRAKIASLKALKNIPLSLKAFKASVPIQSQAMPVDESIVHSIQLQAIQKPRSLKQLLAKSHSLIPFENRSALYDKSRKNSMGNAQKAPYTGRNASNIIRRKMNHENSYFGRGERFAGDRKRHSLDMSLLGRHVDHMQGELDAPDEADDSASRLHEYRQFGRRPSGFRTRAKQFFRDSKQNNRSEKVFQLINAFSEEDLRVESRSRSFDADCGPDEVFEAAECKAQTSALSKSAAMACAEAAPGKSNDTKPPNKQVLNVAKASASPGHSRNCAVKPVAQDSGRNPIVANRALNSSPKHSKPHDVPNESPPNNVLSNNSEYDVRDRSGAMALSGRGAGNFPGFCVCVCVFVGKPKFL